MSKALILDFGGVVTRTLFETHDITKGRWAFPLEALAGRPFDPSTDPLWVSMQAREITERDYWMMARTRETGALLGENWTDLKTFVQRARGAEPELVLRPEARDAILRAKAAGLKLAILSNELDLFYGVEFGKRFPLIELFDVIVDATYTKILKSDPRAYEQVLAELALDRADCVFVDDQKKNIDGAEAVHLPHVHFDVTRPAESYAQALKMLGI
ncbi:haloacid dehalogenase-like family hydrolase [Brucella vulpis]|uniref:HAD-IA family hydrolase n=1 Tax=Brucella vulpis TaxID=981386 RepID=UPI00073ADDDE|nr:haloacid dehalogenase-like family hydrolase [Brucella vulpis]CUW51842.1 haloacid dehalogenase-like family hydrolase [Brucella vulpis]